jgi:hypothetical protein
MGFLFPLDNRFVNISVRLALPDDGGQGPLGTFCCGKLVEMGGGVVAYCSPHMLSTILVSFAPLVACAVGVRSLVYVVV